METFAQGFGMWLALLLLIPWILIILFPIAVFIAGTTALVRELILLLKERRDQRTEEPRGPVYIGMTRRMKHGPRIRRKEHHHTRRRASID